MGLRAMIFREEVCDLAATGRSGVAYPPVQQWTALGLNLASTPPSSRATTTIRPAASRWPSRATSSAPPIPTSAANLVGVGYGETYKDAGHPLAVANRRVTTVNISGAKSASRS
ncbi:hypothetical protein ACE101_02815 [Methylobacterium sp. ID0610]